MKANGMGGFPRGILRRTIGRAARQWLGVVARVVARDGLFEQPGERPAAAPLGSGPKTGGQGVVGGSSTGAPRSQPKTARKPWKGLPFDRPAGVKLIDLAELQDLVGPGGGLRVVNHWATWCHGCVEELPMVRELSARLPEQVRLFGVSWDLFDPRGDEAEIAQHVENFGAGHSLDFPTAVLREDVEPESVFRAFSLEEETVPQTWVIGEQGEVLGRWNGVLTEEGLQTVIGWLGLHNSEQ